MNIAGYEVLSELGRGGMGVVFRARQTALDRDVVLKVLEVASLRNFEECRRRMKREIQILVDLSHPNLVKLLDADWDHDPPFMVFEYLEEAVDLSQLLIRGWPRTMETHRILYAMARGLEFLHQKGVVHRDLKPSNVLLDGRGHARLIDFGLSRQVDSDQTRITSMGQTLGTLSYMAPEQVASPDVDELADVYSFGLIAYELLAGRFVFGALASNPVTLSQRILGAIPPLQERAIDVDPAWAEAVDRCLHRDRSQRIQSISEFLGAVGHSETGPGTAELTRELWATPTTATATPAPAPVSSSQPSRTDRAGSTTVQIDPFGNPARPDAPTRSRQRSAGIVAGSLVVTATLAMLGWSRIATDHEGRADAPAPATSAVVSGVPTGPLRAMRELHQLLTSTRADGLLPLSSFLECCRRDPRGGRRSLEAVLAGRIDDSLGRIGAPEALEAPLMELGDLAAIPVEERGMDWAHSVDELQDLLAMRDLLQAVRERMERIPGRAVEHGLGSMLAPPVLDPTRLGAGYAVISRGVHDAFGPAMPLASISITLPRPPSSRAEVELYLVLKNLHRGWALEVRTGPRHSRIFVGGIRPPTRLEHNPLELTDWSDTAEFPPEIGAYDLMSCRLPASWLPVGGDELQLECRLWRLLDRPEGGASDPRLWRIYAAQRRAARP